MNRFGDGLITLLMFALGLGCLHHVFNGLVDGVVGGAGSATFPFATKPFKFILIEMVWVSLGLVLLLGAWRGVTREQVDIDDEQDDDEDDVATRPMSRPAAPIAAPQALSSSTVARTTTPELLRPLQPVPAPNVNDLHVMRAGPLPKGVEPKTLELYTSRIYAVFVVVVFTGFVISSAYTSVALASIFGKALTAMFFVPTALAYLFTMAQCARNFFWSGPVLVLGKFGITNYRKGGHLIPWTEVDAVRLDTRGLSTYLILRFRHASDVHTHFGKSRWLQSVMGHLFYKGFEGRVKLTSLVFKRSSVLHTAQAFLRYSRR
jgi:hypothetical protein